MGRKYGQRYIKYELTEHGYNAHGEGDAAERCARHRPKVISQSASRIVSNGSHRDIEDIYGLLSMTCHSRDHLGVMLREPSSF